MAGKNRIAVIGASGRMGKAIIQVLSQSKESELSAAVVGKESVCLGLDAGLNSGLKPNGILFTSDLEKAISEADTIIDFSLREVLQEVLRVCVAAGKPAVVGTTGITAEHKKLLMDASSRIPIVYSPNMSVGVNLLFKLTEIAARVMGDLADIEIQDIHHRHKKDSPSGTAEKLKAILLETLGRSESDVIHGRHGILPERDPKEIAIHSFRAGEVIGDHTVFFFTPEERIEISHKAQDRKTFAVGSVRAAEFLVGRKNGLYDMFSVLGI